VFPEHGLVVDLKTTGRMPSTMSAEHQLQRAIYQKARGNQIVKFLYVTPKKTSMLEDGDPTELLTKAKKQISRLEKFLRAGSAADIRDVIPVNPNSFYWNGGEAIREELYGI
jgi:aspartate oxidase